MKRSSLLLVLFIVINACKDEVEPAWKNDIVLVNSFNQDITLTLYWSREVIKVKVGETFTYKQKGTNGPHLDFDFSDSIVVKFADGKRKTDYNCSDKNVNSLIKNCDLDSISLFNTQRYLMVKRGENDYVNYYTFTQADYDEAK